MVERKWWLKKSNCTYSGNQQHPVSKSPSSEDSKALEQHLLHAALEGPSSLLISLRAFIGRQCCCRWRIIRHTGCRKKRKTAPTQATLFHALSRGTLLTRHQLKAACAQKPQLNKACLCESACLCVHVCMRTCFVHVLGSSATHKSLNLSFKSLRDSTAQTSQTCLI